MYCRVPAAVLTHLIRLLRPGGLVCFQEFDISAARSLPAGPLVTKSAGWLVTAFESAGADTRMGMKLHAAFVNSGLPVPSMRLEGLAGGGSDFVGYAMLAEVVRTMLPVIERFGIASAHEIEIDTLAEQLRNEFIENKGTLVIPDFSVPGREPSGDSTIIYDAVPGMVKIALSPPSGLFSRRTSPP